MSGISKSITAIGETESTPANTEKYNALVRYVAGQLPSTFLLNPPMLFEIPGGNRYVAAKPTTTTPPCFIVLPSGNSTRWAYVISNNSHFVQKTLTPNADSITPNGFLINVKGTDTFLFSSTNGNCYRNDDAMANHYWYPYTINRASCPDATSEALTVPILQTVVVAIALTDTTPTYAEVSGDGGLTWIEHLMSNTQRYHKIASCTVPIIGSGIFIAINQTKAAVSSDVGVTWTEYDIGGNYWSQIAYDSARGLFIVIGQGGYTGFCKSSDSGAVWNVVNAAFDLYSNPTDFAIVNGNYILSVIGGSYVSTNGGVTWRRCKNLSGADTYLYGIAAVVEGGATNICYSHASLAGASITADPTGDYAEKVYTTGLEVSNLAVSTSGKFIATGPRVTTISDNGTTWVGGAEVGAGLSTGLVAGPGGEILAFTGNAYYLTTDGITWGTYLDTQISSCIFDGTHYIVADAATGYIRKRTPGGLGVFTAIATLGAAPFGWRLCRKASGRLMCMSRDATWISDDLVTFTKVKGAIAVGISECNFVSSDKSDLFVGVGNTTPSSGPGGCFTSPDAITWTYREVPAVVNSWYRGIAIDQSTGKIVAVSETTQIFSTDGISWEGKAMPTGNWQHIVFSNFHKKFLAVGPLGSSAITSNILEFLC